MYVAIELISGLMIGAEYASQEQAVIIDLIFFRIVIQW